MSYTIKTFLKGKVGLVFIIRVIWMKSILGNIRIRINTDTQELNLLRL